ncbi:cytochrome P450 [Aspergillus cavernicola]|uniref:Cytochrome P450 n=1 Tax=Aspergillus cavernicola TaxID=176166 RepID=A0ABR4IAR9_9EURO
MHAATLVAIAGLLIGVYVATRRKSASPLPLPPGPKPLPIIGNVHQAPKAHGWRTYREWSKQYGSIVHVNMLGQPIIILSTSEVAHDLLAKRGAIFSDRPRLFLATELALKGLNILMMNYTEQFRQYQRLQVSTLESQQLVHDLLENAGGAGADVQRHFQRAVASIIHTLLYGFRVKDYNDPVLRAVVKLNDEFSEFIQVGAHIVDQFPVLNNLPGFLAPWQAKAENHYRTKDDLRNENFRRGLESDAWNISKHLKKTVEKDNLDMPLAELAFELGTMIDAALDGTTDSLIWFVVACITQGQGFVAKAREELDAVVGRDRLPVQDDKPNLPYVAAIVEEIFRWRPAGPEGVPHLNKEETTYNGYRIPKGSVIVPNIWTISREEAVFGPDPDDFIPDRWLNEDGKTLKALPPAAFGYGRRTCPGRYFARNVIWIVVAQLLWSFDIKAGLSEETGEPILIDPIACTYGLVMRALPFKASFNPRGLWVREVIARDGDTYSKDHTAMLNQTGVEFAKL